LIYVFTNFYLISVPPKLVSLEGPSIVAENEEGTFNCSIQSPSQGNVTFQWQLPSNMQKRIEDFETYSVAVIHPEKEQSGEEIRCLVHHEALLKPLIDIIHLEVECELNERFSRKFEFNKFLHFSSSCRS
jgi:hypothetical protein